MRLIDADALIEQLTPSEDVPNNGAKLLLAVFVDAVKAFPTIDAVPVVRCRECARRRFCAFRSEDDNGFCSWGVSGKDGENDG